MAPLQLKRFEVGCSVAAVAFSALQPIQEKKNTFAKSLDSVMHPVYLEH
jgi:hypothetical protein